MTNETNETNEKINNNASIFRIISNIVYAIGVIIFLIFGTVAIFGSNKAVNPDAMLPFTYKEIAFICLAFGAVPMILSCMAVYKFNFIRNSKNKIRNFILIFIPGFICSVCALFIISIIVIAMAKGLIHIIMNKETGV